MNAKNVLYQNFRYNFDENVFVFDMTKHVMSFFRKFVNNDINRVIVVRIEKIDNEIHENVFLTLFEHRWKNQQIVVTINQNFETTINVTITNVLINNNFYVWLIMLSSSLSYKLYFTYNENLIVKKRRWAVKSRRFSYRSSATMKLYAILLRELWEKSNHKLYNSINRKTA